MAPQRLTIPWRYEVGDLVRCGGWEWTVVARRYIERQLLPPYREYLLGCLSPQYGTRWEANTWEVEADLEPLEE